MTEDPLTCGATMIDGTELTSDTRIVIQHYSYKKHDATEPSPVFVVRPSDRVWFAEFREELENLWRDSSLWPEPKSLLTPSNEILPTHSPLTPPKQNAPLPNS